MGGWWLAHPQALSCQEGKGGHQAFLEEKPHKYPLCHKAGAVAILVHPQGPEPDLQALTPRLLSLPPQEAGSGG